MLRHAIAIAASVPALLYACSSREHPHYAAPPSESDAATEAGPIQIDSGIDPDALCGDQEISVLSDPPNVYFVLDRSGSMGDTLSGNGLTKYENARQAISTMLRSVGHRIRYGAAVFPATSASSDCAPGAQIFPVTAGDPPSYAAAGQPGPVLIELLQRLGSVLAGGGTATAATLEGLLPDLTALGGKTYVVLMTDGVPNCNSTLLCASAECSLNIEGISVNGVRCNDAFNCCDPLNVGPAGPDACVDAAATVAAVSDLAAAGIDTYVVGMPGTEQYSALLDRLAEAGHTAQAGVSKYYAVSDTDALTSALKTIGAQVAISCDIPLAEAPDNPGLVNVYFDGRVVPFSAADGWDWASPTSIRIEGQACTRLASGDVLAVRVIEGCETIVP